MSGYIFKAEIDSAVKALLTLKSSYKALTGVEWNPNLVPAPANKLAPTPVATSGTSDSLSVQITECGNKVRDLKANKAAKVYYFIIYGHKFMNEQPM